MITRDNRYTVVVEDGQNVWDIAIQAYGDIGEVFRLLADNDLSIDNDLSPLQSLSIEAKVADSNHADLREYFRTKQIKVNTHDHFIDTSYLLQENSSPILQEDNHYLLVY